MPTLIDQPTRLTLGWSLTHLEVDRTKSYGIMGLMVNDFFMPINKVIGLKGAAWGLSRFGTLLGEREEDQVDLTKHDKQLSLVVDYFQWLASCFGSSWSNGPPCCNITVGTLYKVWCMEIALLHNEEVSGIPIVIPIRSNS
ncbi:hypothetical protein Tco_0677471 [Tanacetum coccineum]|uniref:Aminotransferase-like plant mobile domain-containing protein n=1 Tax=Tanacetum coccineum TaxID=301880 RepID=A0ABQ4XDL9_9ASTR